MDNLCIQLNLSSLYNIDSLQEQLEETMKLRLSMITRQVRIVKNAEEEIRQLKRKLDNFDRYASATNLPTGLENLIDWTVLKKILILSKSWFIFRLYRLDTMHTSENNLSVTTYCLHGPFTNYVTQLG